MLSSCGDSERVRAELLSEPGTVVKKKKKYHGSCLLQKWMTQMCGGGERAIVLKPATHPVTLNTSW